MLHTHWESQFDAVPKIQDMFRRLQEIGIKSVAVTDHGSLCALQDVLDYNANLPVEDQLNIIYGVEAYLEYRGQIDKPAHFIIMAKDKIGKTAIDKLMYDANNNINKKNMPVATESMLKQYFGIGGLGYGHCVFTTACISGVPALDLLENKNAHEAIGRIQKKIDDAIKKKKAILPDDDIRMSFVHNVKDRTYEQANLRLKRDALKKVASKKTKMLEKRLQSVEKINDIEEINRLKAEIENVKNNAQNATEEINKIAIRLKVLKNEISENNSKLKEYNEKAERYNTFKKEIAEQNKRLKDNHILFEEAVRSVERLRDIVGAQNLYIELQYHGLTDEKAVYPVLAQIAKQLGLPVVAANDAHMADNSEDSLNARRIVKFLRFGNIMEGDREGGESYEAEKEMYLKNEEELSDALLKILPSEVVKESIQNADKIGELCHYKQVTEDHYPVYDKNVDSKILIRKLAKEGITWRFPNREDFTDEYRIRLKKELDVICNMGYADYHLIMKEVLEYARILGNVPPEYVNEVPLDIEEARIYVAVHGWDVGIGVGPGRGSAAGSLVCFLLGITNVDPLKYDLLFERFLNPERVSMPDIDSDFRTDIRNHTVAFVVKKYGKGAVCKILTKRYEGTKGAIADAARYYGELKYRDPKRFLTLGTEIRKVVPVFLNINFSMKMSDVSRSYVGDQTVFEYVCSCFSENDDALAILKLAKAVEGSFSYYGIHAAGVVISDNDDVTDYVALRYNVSKKLWETQITKDQVEANGLLKMDFLNLQNLDIISSALRMIKQNHGVKIDPINLPIENEVIERIFATGMTTGVFQCESAGMRKYMKKLHPTSIEDLILLNAMYRPGPEQFLDDVCAVKNGFKKTEYVTKELEPILSKTYSAIVYQEQVMEICQKLAGYSLGRADLVRRYMSKKKTEKLKGERHAFVYGDPKSGISGCIKNGISETAANKLFDQMTDFSKYAFNKSHAAAYAVVMYSTAWIKYHYPAEYLCALLSSKNKVEDYTMILNEAAEFHVEVCAPDINMSGVDFTVVDGKIVFGLKSLKGIGKAVAENIINERKTNGHFKSFKDYMTRIGLSAVTLVDAGCFDKLGISRASLKGPWYTEIESTGKEIREKIKLIANYSLAIDLLKQRHFDSMSDFKEVLKKRNIVFSSTAKKVPTIESIETKIFSAKRSERDLRKKMSEIEIWKIPEDTEEKLMAEKRVMGVFLSGHPMDKYIAESAPIAELTEADTKVSGVITDINEKIDRNGNKFAFLTLSDRSGDIKVTVFAKSYLKYMDLLKLGKGVFINGRVDIDDFNSDEESGEIVYQVIANKVHILGERKNAYCIEVSSEADYFFELEDQLKLHCDSTGIILLIYIKNHPCYRKVKRPINKEWAVSHGAYIMPY